MKKIIALVFLGIVLFSSPSFSFTEEELDVSLEWKKTEVKGQYDLYTLPARQCVVTVEKEEPRFIAISVSKIESDGFYMQVVTIFGEQVMRDSKICPKKDESCTYDGGNYNLIADCPLHTLPNEGVRAEIDAALEAEKKEGETD